MATAADLTKIIIRNADAETRAKMYDGMLATCMALAPALKGSADLIDAIIKQANDETRDKMYADMLAVCKSLAVTLNDDAAKWAHCGLVPGGQKQPRACIHQPLLKYHLPDGTLFAEVKWAGYAGGGDNYYTRTVYLSNGILTEYWRCCLYTCIDTACHFESAELKPYPAKRSADDDITPPVAPALRG